MALYSPALGAPLFFDDIPNLLDNTLVQISGAQFDGWRVAALSSSAGEIERSVAMLSFAFNHVVSGELSPNALKLTNLLLHVACAGLVYGFTGMLFRSPALRDEANGSARSSWVPMLAALLWLLHPLHVSTVMYSVQRMAQLSTFFTLAGLVFYLHHRLQWAQRKFDPVTVKARAMPVFLWLALLGMLAVFSKENGALLPWLIVATEVALFKSVWCGRRSRSMAILGWVLLVLPIVFLAVIFVFAPEWVLDRYDTREFTLSERLLTQARVLWYYVSWTFVPSLTQLGFFHDDIVLSRGLFAPVTTLPAVLGWLFLLVSAYVLRSRLPLFFFAVLFFLVAHSLESSVIPLEMVFEHRNYLPSVALAIFGAYGLTRAGEILRKKAPSFSGWVPGAVVLLVFSLLLGTRAYMWRDDFSFARFNVVNHPESPRANFYYANVLYSKFLEASDEELAEDERAALAVSARHYYLKMHTLDSRDIAALVMLYQLDAWHFPGLAQQQDWLSKIEALAVARRLQRSDTTALGALVRHVLSAQDSHSDMTRVDALLETLRKRDPGKLGLLALRYRLLKGQPERRAEIGSMLEEYVARKPKSRKAAAYLAQFHGGSPDDGALAETYAAVGRWLANDATWQEVSEIRAVFEP
ncbi:MAG: hypothetical protein AB8C02_02390 [Halioglobus sp.]